MVTGLSKADGFGGPSACSNGILKNSMPAERHIRYLNRLRNNNVGI